MKPPSACRPLLPCLIIVALFGCQPNLLARQKVAAPPVHARHHDVPRRVAPVHPVVLAAFAVVALPLAVVGAAFMVVTLPLVLVTAAIHGDGGSRRLAERPGTPTRPMSTGRRAGFAVRPGSWENGGRGRPAPVLAR